jgi:alpha-tubulin suppressor-like RCC1 family protein
MKKKIISFIMTIFLIVIISLLAGCSVPQQSEKKDASDKQRTGGTEQQASIENLQYALGPNTYIVAVAGGGLHSLALDSHGRVWVTGSNMYGEIGLGTRLGINEWINTGLDNVTAIACGRNFSLVLRNMTAQGGKFGEVWVAGENRYGQLGTGDNTDRNTWTWTPACYATDISAGEYHSLLISGGTVWATGRNEFGQLGFGDTIDRNGFTFTGATNVKSIAAGARHSLILTNNGTVWATGDNRAGQLGIGKDITEHHGFIQTPGINSVSVIAAGSYHSLALRDRTGQGGTFGEVWVTGDNSSGQLGTGDTKDRYNWEYTGACYCSAVAAGLGHSTVMSSGTIWATGNNYNGQLGFGDTNQRNRFYPTGACNCSSIADGYWHSIVISSGTVWTTGLNTYGQLGQNNSTNQYTGYTRCP